MGVSAFSPATAGIVVTIDGKKSCHGSKPTVSIFHGKRLPQGVSFGVMPCRKGSVQIVVGKVNGIVCRQTSSDKKEEG